jgi:hypothetical protein
MSYLVDALTEIGPAAAPYLIEIGDRNRGSWWGGEAEAALAVVHDARRLAAYRAHRATVRAIGPPRAFVDAALAMWRAGQRTEATERFRTLSEHSGGAPVRYLVEGLTELGPEAAPVLDEIARAHHGTWWGREAAQARRAVRAPGWRPTRPEPRPPAEAPVGPAARAAGLWRGGQRDAALTAFEELLVPGQGASVGYLLGGLAAFGADAPTLREIAAYHAAARERAAAATRAPGTLGRLAARLGPARAALRRHVRVPAAVRAAAARLVRGR